MWIVCNIEDMMYIYLSGKIMGTDLSVEFLLLVVVIFSR